MNDQELQGKLEQAVWTAHSLFERGKTAGSSANMSFLHEDRIYITGSGTCFGTLKKEDFAVVDFSEKRYNEVKPSKELPLHKIFYEKNPKIKAVIHTHSFYSVLISCLNLDASEKLIPKYTPYLEMKVGEIGLVPYAPPGTKELFALFEKEAGEKKGYLLRNHGLLVGGKNIMEAFYGAEELEESAKVAWYLRGEHVSQLP